MSNAATAPKRGQTDYEIVCDYMARHPGALRPGEFKEWSQSSAKRLALPMQVRDDALIIGMIDRDLLDKPVSLGFSQQGLETPTDGWTNWDKIEEDGKDYPLTVYDVINRRFTRHVGGEKGGSCLLQGSLSASNRGSKTADTNYFLILDFDNGTSFDQLVNDMRNRGLFFIAHTSHSHLSRQTEIVRDKLIDFCGQGDGYDPTDEDAARYRREKLKVMPAFCEGTRIVDKLKKTDRGVCVVAEHPPLPKMRLVLLLKTPFEFMKIGAKQATRIDEWKARYLAASDEFGVFCDPACQDAARLFFLPRHKKGTDDHRIVIGAGEPFDFEALPLPPPAKTAKTTKSAVGTSRKARPERVRDLALPSLDRFWKKYGRRFDVVRFFGDHRENATERPDGGLRCDCPDGDAHGNGDPGGFWCENGAEREGGWPIACCSHQTHHGLLTEDYVDLLASALAGIETAKDLWEYVLDKAEGETCDIEDDAPFASFDEALAECGRDQPTKAKEKDLRDPRHLLTLARRIGASTCLKEGEPLLLLNRLKNSTVGLPSLKEAMQAGARKRPRSTERDDAGLPEGFEIVDDRTQRKVWRGDKEEWVTVCSAIRNLGFLYDENGQGHGHLIEAVDRLGHKRQIGFEHAETLRDAGAFLGRLAKEGNIWFDGTAAAHGHAVTLFSRLPVGEPILNASKPGFHTVDSNTIYIPPMGSVIGAEPGKVRLQEAARLPKTTPKGTLEGWRQSAGELLSICDFHGTMILSAGYAGPLIALLRLPSCGMAFTGDPAIGKSLAMKIASAIWGAVLGKAGLFMTALGSATGQELSAVQGNGASFFLDEIKQLDPRTLQRVLFMLSEGMGKARGNADVTLRPSTSWSFYFVTSGEVELEKLIEKGNETKAGGLDRRVPEIDTSGAKSCDDLGRVKTLEGVVDDNYGWAGPAFVQWLFDKGYVDDPRTIRQMIVDKAKELLGGEGADKPTAVRAAAYTVAVANVAGLLARDAGLFPVVPGRDIDADFMTGWRRSLGGEGAAVASDVDAAILRFWGRLGDLWPLHGVTVDEAGLRGSVGEPAEPMLSGNEHREHLFYKGTALMTKDERQYVVVRDCKQLDEMIGVAVKRKAFLRAMGDNLIRHGENARWEKLPKECGGGPGANYRIILPAAE